MRLFYRVTDKLSFDTRNKIFEDNGIPLLTSIGFEKSPFLGTCFGKYDNTLNCYELCRLTDTSLLQMITVYIDRNDKWIKIYLNIFQLDSSIKSLYDLSSFYGTKFKVPPNSISQMRLNVDDFKGIPLFNFDFIFRNHKLKSPLTKWGFNRNQKRLKRILKADLKNFEKYIDRWNNLYKPLMTTVEGEIVGLKSMNLNERLEIARLTEKFKEAKIKYKEQAKNMLKWVEIDDSEIKSIMEKV
jgi:hypothetical protein